MLCSGLDTHITPGAAAFRVPRVARPRRLPEGQVRDFARQYKEARPYAILAETRVNVLRLGIKPTAAWFKRKR